MTQPASRYLIARLQSHRYNSFARTAIMIAIALDKPRFSQFAVTDRDTWAVLEIDRGFPKIGAVYKA